MNVATNGQDFIDFEVDASLIGSLIHSQNGTISTSLRELVMNCFDHKSTKCEIRLGATGFEVVDNGLGFQGKESVEKFFKRFGEPHKEGDAQFGRFRIGRAQAMSFGVIEWHSNEFKMTTDVKNKGYGFSLTEDKNNVFKGCKVTGTFYEKVDSWNLREACTELEKLVKYLDDEVSLNGICISNYGKESVWDFEDDDLKIKWNPNRFNDGLYLYSLGVFVKEISGHFFGLNADIVTKKALTLNMARNEINHNDPLWQKISKILQDKSLESGKEKCRKSKNIDEPTRRSLIKQFLSGNLPFQDIINMPLLRDCRGHTFKVNLFWNSNCPVVVSPESGNRIASHIAATKIALVLHHDELRIWDCSEIHELCDIYFNAAIFEGKSRTANVISEIETPAFEDVARGINESYTLLIDKTLSKRHRAAKAAIQYASKIMAGRIATILQIGSLTARKIHIGESVVADGWTDAKCFIAVSNHMLPLLDKGPSGAAQIIQLLLHEYCHDESDIGSHEHDFSFYEKFHDLSSNYKTEVIGNSTESLYNQYLRELMKRNEKIPEATARKYDFPIINDIVTYTGHIKGSGLSPLATLLLDATQASYKVTKKTFEATINHENAKFVIKRVSSALRNAIEKDGVTFLDSTSVSAVTANWQESNRILAEDYKQKGRAWAEKNNHDPDFVESLIDKHVHFSLLLQLICSDKNSGLYCFDTKELYSNRRMFSGHYNFGFRTDSNTGFRGSRINNSILANSKEHRFTYAVNAIKDIINGFENEEERQEFLKKYTADNLAIQLR